MPHSSGCTVPLGRFQQVGGKPLPGIKHLEANKPAILPIENHPGSEIIR